MWADWFGNIEIKKWVKAYFVKRGVLYDTLLAHLTTVYQQESEEVLMGIAHKLETEVCEVMGWTST